MNAIVTRTVFATVAVALAMLAHSSAQADPIVGRDTLKFSQLPMNDTPIVDNSGSVTLFDGHDELSTAYLYTGMGAIYLGKTMSDDFADNFNSPVVHVKWWGSYLNDFIHPDFPVDKFLISFSDDVPAVPGNPNSFSHPTPNPRMSQTVFRDPDGSLSVGEGTFTERALPGGSFETLYEYNAELHLDFPFPQEAGHVYWLSIAALVDADAFTMGFDPHVPTVGDQVTRWGWHNRDYTVSNLLASPAVSPGEYVEGQVGPVGSATDVWHFQDDSTSSNVSMFPGGPGGFISPAVGFGPFTPQRYVNLADGPIGVNAFSKDLAFELYTTRNVPEPASLALILFGATLLSAWRRDRNR